MCLEQRNACVCVQGSKTKRIIPVYVGVSGQARIHLSALFESGLKYFHHVLLHTLYVVCVLILVKAFEGSIQMLESYIPCITCTPLRRPYTFFEVPYFTRQIHTQSRKFHSGFVNKVERLVMALMNPLSSLFVLLIRAL